jgi:hypothetical protein
MTESNLLARDKPLYDFPAEKQLSAISFFVLMQALSLPASSTAPAKSQYRFGEHEQLKADS